MNDNFWANPDIDMTKIKDSMQIDSGTQIASVKIPGAYAVIEVRGEVKIWYNEKEWFSSSNPGDCYRYPSEFPESLKNLIVTDRDWYSDPHIFVDNNNWFEIFIGVDENDPIPNSDVIDIEGASNEDLHRILATYANEYVCLNTKEEEERE